MATKNIVPDAVIDRRILWLRQQKVMLDFHLAELSTPSPNTAFLEDND